MFSAQAKSPQLDSGRLFCARAIACVLLVGWGFALHAQPVQRDAPRSGAVISRASGEVITFVRTTVFRDLVVGQELVAGDIVRTGPLGLLGLLFVDRTTMRLHPNTEMVVKEVAPQAATIQLRSGQVWARAPRRQDSNVRVETASATAAIRGTDWSLSVDAHQRTVLQVFDGEVELSNPLGSVVARAGEGASAVPGQAPQLLVVASFDERSQMLFVFTARDAADQLLASTNSILDGAPSAEFASAVARYRTGDNTAAIAAFSRVARSAAASREEAAAADWMAAYIRVIAGGHFRAPAPRGTKMDVFGHAYQKALVGDLAGAAQALGPVHNTKTGLANAILLAMTRDREGDARRLLADLIALAPESYERYFAEGQIALAFDVDPARAAALFARATEKDPSARWGWASLAGALSELDHPVESHAARRTALELDPLSEDGILDQIQDAQSKLDLRRAEREVAKLEALSPGAFPVLLAKSQLAMARREDDKALEYAYQALAAQPGVADASLNLATLAYQNGDVTRALQELDAAERLDPNSLEIPLRRVTIAIDQGQADAAIRAARRAQDLIDQGRVASTAPAGRRSGDAISAAYNTLGLNAWARDIADRSYDAISASSLFDEAGHARFALTGDSTRNSYSLSSSGLVGTMLNPLGTAGRFRYSDLVRRPFFDVELRHNTEIQGPRAMQSSVAATGFTLLPLPLSFYATANQSDRRGDRSNDIVKIEDASLTLGVQPHYRLGVLLGSTATEIDEVLPGLTSFPVADKVSGARRWNEFGLSYRLGKRRVLLAYAAQAHDEQNTLAVDSGVDVFGDPWRIEYRDQLKGGFTFAGLSFRAVEDHGTWYAGVERETSKYDLVNQEVLTDFFGTLTQSFNSELKSETVRKYVQYDHRFGGAFGVMASAKLGWVTLDTDPDPRFEPRLAFAMELANGHRVRVGWMKDVASGSVTLRPETILGLAPYGMQISRGGESKTWVVRYDGELSDRLHFSAEYQDLRLSNLSFETKDLLLGSLPISAADVQRGEIRLESWLGNGIGAFASFAVANSEITKGFGAGFGLPALPDKEARFGLAWVHPSQIRANAQLRYIGKRADVPTLPDLDPAWTLDAGLSWQPLDKHVSVNISGSNLLDAALARGVEQGSEGRRIGVNVALRF